LNEARVEADVLGEGSGLTDRGGREIDPGHPCTQTGPAQRVEPEVARQVEQLLSIDGPDLGHLVRPKLV